MAKSRQEMWIGLLGLVDFLTEKWEEWSFDLYDWKEELMERGEMADEDFRAFLREISERRDNHRTGRSEDEVAAGEPVEAPALEQTKASPLRESLKRGQMSAEQDHAAEVVEQELDEVIKHIDPET